MAPRFTEKRLTSLAGLVPLLKFTNEIGLEETVEKQVALDRGRNKTRGWEKLCAGSGV